MESAELRAWMDARGYSNQTLADALEVSRSTVLRWTTGKYPIPAYVPLALVGLEKIPDHRK